MKVPHVNEDTSASTTHTATSAMFDPTDLKYKAVLSNLKPNKETSWPYPKEKDGWVHAHNAIRADLQTIQECLQLVLNRRQHDHAPLQAWEIQALVTIYDAHDHFIYEHHTNEDGVLAPLLATRILKPDKHSGFVDHEGLVQQMEGISTALHNLNDNQDQHDEQDDEVALTTILKKFKVYSGHMRAHLQEEEDFGLPLMRAYFTPQDVAPTIQKMNKNTSKVRKVCVVVGIFYWKTFPGGSLKRVFCSLFFSLNSAASFITWEKRGFGPSL